MAIDQDSYDLTRVGPGTVMGDMMRQYWIPAAMSSELEADGAPVRLLILGEKLIGFRDTSGKVGIMDHRCPHRCASLFLGRNEEDGLRCIYHGWKFDVDGNCVDMPSVPAHQDFKDKVHAKAYKTYEKSGLVWVYMGDRAVAPPPPMIEVTQAPEAELTIALVQRECNFVQSLEGDIDTSHFGFLHFGSVGPDDLPEDHPLYYAVTDRAPEYFVTDMPWGTTYGAYRAAGEGQTYWRTANFLFPFWTQNPAGDFPIHVHARAWVPMDDDHTMFFNLRWTGNTPRGSSVPMKDGKSSGLNPKANYLPNTTDWYGRWRLAANERNDWKIDREAQRNNVHYSGIDNVHLQDQSVTESMGGITEHAFEHLAPSDQMIARTRRRLLRAARALREHGQIPPGVDDPQTLLEARSGFFIVDNTEQWPATFQTQIERAERPFGQPQPRAAE